MRRREFIGLLGGTAVALPVSALAQRTARRIGALWPFKETDPDGEAVLEAFRTGLRELGWGGVQIESRWGGGNVATTKAYAAELVRLSPDIIFAHLNAQLGPLSRETRTIPIVFVGASDPVGAGYVASLAHPGGNITGFTLFESTLAGKWLGLLKEVTPGLVRVGLLINPETAILRGTFYTQTLNAAASALGVEPLVAKVFNASDSEAAIQSLAK